jgi:cytochrome c-type biogenesis protein CcmH/NrfF
VRRVLTLTAVALLLCIAGAAVWRSAAASGAREAHEIAAGLRCLACEGETVADSTSPVAAGMREVIDDQLAAGRTEEQIRAWFEDRYGPDVLADPPRQGIGALLWARPCAALLTGLVVATRALRRPTRAPAAEKPRHAGAPGPRDLVWYAIALTVVGVVAAVALGAQQSTPARTAAPAAESPGDPLAEQLALARQRERQQDYAGAADSYRAAADMRPDPAIRLRLAFALLRSNQAAEAASVARRVLQDRQDDPDALLLLGLALRAENSAEAEPTLRRFLELAPQHPAVAEVRDLLGLP